MACIRIKGERCCPDGVVCGFEPVYRYGGFKFENHHYFGPVKLRLDGEVAKATGRKFYAAFERWEKLTKKQREKYRVERYER